MFELHICRFSACHTLLQGQTGEGDVTGDQFETSAWCGPWHGVMSSPAQAASVSPRLWQDNRYQSPASTCFNAPWVNPVTTNWFIRRCESDLYLPQMINMWAVPCVSWACVHWLASAARRAKSNIYPSKFYTNIRELYLCRWGNVSLWARHIMASWGISDRVML